jgi:hypothetical protein
MTTESLQRAICFSHHVEPPDSLAPEDILSDVLLYACDESARPRLLLFGYDPDVEDLTSDLIGLRDWALQSVLREQRLDRETNRRSWKTVLHTTLGDSELNIYEVPGGARWLEIRDRETGSIRRLVSVDHLVGRTDGTGT